MDEVLSLKFLEARFGSSADNSTLAP